MTLFEFCMNVDITFFWGGSGEAERGWVKTSQKALYSQKAMPRGENNKNKT